MARRDRKESLNSFAGIPRIVMETPDYIGLSFVAKSLLSELAYQYKGNNNGNLTVALSILRKRGWRRSATISRATQELISASLIIRTRESRFSNPGSRCALYALSWRHIDECPGKDLDVGPTTKAPRQFSLEKIQYQKSGNGKRR